PVETVVGPPEKRRGPVAATGIWKSVLIARIGSAGCFLKACGTPSSPHQTVRRCSFLPGAQAVWPQRWLHCVSGMFPNPILSCLTNGYDSGSFAFSFTGNFVRWALGGARPRLRWLCSIGVVRLTFFGLPKQMPDLV